MCWFAGGRSTASGPGTSARQVGMSESSMPNPAHTVLCRMPSAVAAARETDSDPPP
jgi:hypothetical protein